MSVELDYITKQTHENPTAVVIWLHGLGADGHDFESIIPALKLPSECAIRFIFPHAPVRTVTVSGGVLMRAWYDIEEVTLERKVDMANVEESMLQVNELIEEQIKQGIPSRRILLAGFSQGGAIAYQLGLFCKYKLAGIMALSTYLVTPKSIPNAAECLNGDTPILIHHGSEDPVVPLELGEKAKTILTEKGFQVNSKVYAMPHAVCPEQINDISTWLQKHLP
ncbi:carboxylesterase [Marinomonas agarivorans]|nr:carboxylesterase [Marinomonas agarivorans]